MGRPTDNPRTEKIGIRISKNELDMLQACAEAKKTTRANIIIEGIEKVYQELQDKKK